VISRFGVQRDGKNQHATNRRPLSEVEADRTIWVSEGAKFCCQTISPIFAPPHQVAGQEERPGGAARSVCEDYL